MKLKNKKYDINNNYYILKKNKYKKLNLKNNKICFKIFI